MFRGPTPSERNTQPVNRSNRSVISHASFLEARFREASSDGKSSIAQKDGIFPSGRPKRSHQFLALICGVGRETKRGRVKRAGQRVREINCSALNLALVFRGRAKPRISAQLSRGKGGRGEWDREKPASENAASLAGKQASVSRAATRKRDIGRTAFPKSIWRRWRERLDIRGAVPRSVGPGFA